MNHVSVDVRQAEFSPPELVDQTPMVDAEQVQHRRVEIMNVDDVLLGVVTELVRSTVRETSPDAAARHPHGESLDVVVAAGALCHRRAAELTAPDDESFVEHAALLEVLDQRGGSLIDVPGRLHDSVLDVAVVIPAAVIEVNKAYAPFRQAAGEQAVGGEREPSAGACKPYMLQRWC